ncbi:hypothetical protein QUB80_06370 [Chlorogloeopsis sp. ULAP01]|uniref:hypothetical protein n=1 Tax=Chlorogloeopsis sp. ULAP01 TaxID=3056483 RepID=UPI0025AB1DF7|nr:hypothetical protein [Chlorogloeopsis sp. ULAP01]MDM9380325.1 hypothetical protein [Chlorogloeopsis sp. ULAP01]
MELRNSKGNQNNQANQALNNNSNKLCDQLLKRFVLYCSNMLLVAIALLVSPVQAEDRLVVIQDSESVTPELETLFFNADPSASRVSILVLKAIILNNEQPHKSTQDSLSSVASTKDINLTRSLNQAANLLPEPSIASIESASWLNHIVQADVPTPQPSEPFSQPGSSNAPREPLGEPWQISVEPYFFIPLDVRADVTAAGRSASIRAGLGEILNLDRAFDAGLRLEARKNRFGLILDGFYLSAGQSGNLGVTFPQGSLQSLGINTDVRLSTDGSVSVRQGTINLAAFYRVLDTPLNNPAKSSNLYPRLVIDPILGLRTNIRKQEIEVDNIRIGNTTVPVERDFRFSRTTVEPLIGARIELDLSERWTMGIRGDVSGFNINADRDITWNLLVGTRYRLSPTTSLQLAYGFNDFDFEDGEGLRRARLNLHQQGAWLSVMFQF